MPFPFAPMVCVWFGSVFLSATNAASKVPRDMTAAVMESKPGFIIAQAKHAKNAMKRTSLTRGRIVGAGSIKKWEF